MDHKAVCAYDEAYSHQHEASQFAPVVLAADKTLWMLVAQNTRGEMLTAGPVLPIDHAVKTPQDCPDVSCCLLPQTGGRLKRRLSPDSDSGDEAEDKGDKTTDPPPGPPGVPAVGETRYILIEWSTLADSLGESVPEKAIEMLKGLDEAGLEALPGKGLVWMQCTLKPQFALFVPTGWLLVEISCNCPLIYGFRKGFFTFMSKHMRKYEEAISLSRASQQNVTRMEQILQVLKDQGKPPSSRRNRSVLVHFSPTGDQTCVSDLTAQRSVQKVQRMFDFSRPKPDSEIPVGKGSPRGKSEICYAGIGGWWMLPSDGICPASICWFSIAIQAAELPDWFVQEHGRNDLQKYICAVEVLAQLVLAELLVADSRVCPTSACLGQVVLRQSCDNSGVCGAVSKASSMRRPLVDVLQSMATLRMQRNTWADLLSRGRAASESPEFWESLDPRRSRTADWRRILNAGQLR
ncbi:unnamed protein product [Symbiodinium sp. CCMP2592]|nr:unnamed protein product [Symbiodinium sp. CCMP2592]